jgi:hypothetical protein
MRDDKGITEDEAALYDRQIRLWGVEAQKKCYNFFFYNSANLTIFN